MSSVESQYIEAAAAPMETAHCLPFSVYTSEEAFQLEKERIFHQDWVFICAERALPEPGDYQAITLADEPIVVIRGEDGQLRALSNVCRHRGTPLMDEGVGKTRRLVCPYHAWTYQADGKFLGAPHTDKNEINGSAHCLPQFKLEIWQGLVFVSLNPLSQPLNERFAGIERYLKLYGHNQFNCYFPDSSVSWQCNWKVALENAMESYHLFKVHGETLEQYTPTKQAYYLEGSAAWTLTAGKYAKNNKVADWLFGEGSPVEQHYVLISLPPSFVAILTHESLSWIAVYPEGPNQCRIQSGGLSTPGEVSQQEESFAQAFLAEDKVICERVQRGMCAQHSQGGKLVEKEKIIIDFHQYLSDRLTGKNVADSPVTVETSLL